MKYSVLLAAVAALPLAVKALPTPSEVPTATASALQPVDTPANMEQAAQEVAPCPEEAGVPQDAAENMAEKTAHDVQGD
ncbi:hypothetical protein HRG_009345 [Hirsutella rhossiliensis]|uniref:Uncharacterized protein n=1 Tax=Hirsutella rhossiliensis TaxID=111463 RepID=A0A9P8MNQ8_9HYPO|nr:uncharacterized protein HRG_09345 [Hirsutella rhossiliensis]KAH0959563.1 hypothetical protein HRG_09345 [Hirsutella rhossiliensis]